MRRKQQLIKHCRLDGKGIEVAPYFKPILRKSEADILIIDVFDTEELRRRAAADPLIDDAMIPNIEPVDFVGDASNIEALVGGAGLAGQIDFVLSSHNFEHLPNPVKFLRGCQAILRPGGVISMAVPDGRACFDFYRMPTRLADWLDAYEEDRTMPAPATVFDGRAVQSMVRKRSGLRPAAKLGLDSPSRFVPNRDLAEVYAAYLQSRAEPGTYHDAHCTVFFPETAELMLRDLRFLGLIDLEIIEITPTRGNEFVIHLRKPEVPSRPSDDEFYALRDRLLARIPPQMGAAPYHWSRLLLRPDRLLIRLLRMI